MRLISLSLIVMLLSCAPQDSSHVLTDELWVQVADPSSLTRWVADPTPLWDLTRGADGDLFAEILGVAFDPEGALVIADHQTARIHFVTPEGVPVRTVGRVGSGPGELRSIDGFGLSAGGRVWGYDASRRRLVVFEANESDTLTTSLHNLGPVAWPMVVGLIADEDLFIIETHLSKLAGPSGRLVRDSTRLLHYRMPHGSATKVVPVTTRPREDLFIHPTGRSLAGVGFGPRLAVALDPARHRAYWGFSDALLIERWTPGGAIETFVDYQVNPRRVNVADRDDVLRRAEELSANVAADLPENVPAFERLLVATNGWLWVKEYLPEKGGPTRWAVFDTVGTLRQVVDLPARFDLLAVNGDTAAGIAEDRWGEQSVRLLRLVEMLRK